MKTTRRSVIKGLGAVAAALGLSRWLPATRPAQKRFASVTMWNGKIVGFRVYNRVLSAKEIQAIANDPWGLYTPVKQGGET